MLRIHFVTLPILLFFQLFYLTPSYAQNLPACNPRQGGATLEVTTAYGFADATFNQQNFLFSLSSSAESWNDGSETHTSYGQLGRSVVEEGTLYTRHCVYLGELERLDHAPESITVTFGPRKKSLSLIGLQEQLDAARDALANDPDHYVVLREPQIIELDPAADPDWVSIERLELVTLTDGGRALRLKFFNPRTTRTQPARLELFASEGGCPYASIGDIIRVNVRFREVDGDLEALVNDIEYGDEQVAEIETRPDACGNLSVSFELAKLPALSPGEALSLNFTFGAVDGQAFWGKFKHGGITVDNDTFWPPYAGIYVE
ncbi:hypothetical protein [uncultured Tateyamaria sp.]|uniref:hypothetical protein n=1 Tax=uncultured Tateyamaria sp. TaxID=455651 RepID=UPI002634D047|nr:hypothetical protein [uncultured Tateyamaria sp.]